MPETTGIMKRLTAKEEEIMGYFWEKGPLFVKQLLEYYEAVSYTHLRAHET